MTDKKEDKKTGDKVCEEMAERDFARFVEEMDLDIDTKYMNDEEEQSFQDIKRRLIRNIVSGDLIVNDNGEPIYTPTRSENKNPITFYEYNGSNIMAMDGKGKKEDVRKLFSIMASITKTNVPTFSKMKGKDLRICQAITTLLMG